MSEFTDILEKELRAQASPAQAVPMQQYMKGRFPFLGIKNEARKKILKPIWDVAKKEVNADFREITKELFGKPEREFQYCAMEIFGPNLKKQAIKEDISLIRELILAKSWWDSVDFFARHALGVYLQKFPSEIPNVIKDFSTDENLWLNRSALLFQLGYREKTDANLLFSLCLMHRESNEFFIQKAIGWALREYAKTNASAVVEFVGTSNLKPLSKREALKNL